MSNRIQYTCHGRMDKRYTRASFDLVRLCIVSDIGRLGLGYLHQTVFLYFRQSQVLFIPLQAAVCAEHGSNHLSWLANMDSLGLGAVDVRGILENSFWLRGGSVKGRDGRLGMGMGILLLGHVEDTVVLSYYGSCTCRSAVLLW